MRGEPWQYLCEWALVTVIIIAAVWVLGWLSGCLAETCKKKVRWFNALSSLRFVFLEALPILIHLLTLNEMALYGFASFKIVASGSVDINYFKLIISILVMLYYILYPVRLIVLAVRFSQD